MLLITVYGIHEETANAEDLAGRLYENLSEAPEIELPSDDITVSIPREIRAGGAPDIFVNVQGWPIYLQHLQGRVCEIIQLTVADWVQGEPAVHRHVYEQLCISITLFNPSTDYCTTYDLQPEEGEKEISG